MATTLTWSEVDSDLVCCGVRIDPLNLDDAVRRLQSLALGGYGRSVHLCNAYTLSLARQEASYASLLNRSDLNLPDGMPLMWVAQRAGFALNGERPRGADVFTKTVETGVELGLKHYLYGGTSAAVEAVRHRLLERAPGARIVGAESPPFRPLSDREEVRLIDRVQQLDPDIVWVGLGTPKQDVFVDDFRDRLSTTLVAIGAAFDFVAGTKKEAPDWMQEHGLEWLYRFGSEPRRLWKRYLVGNTRFLAGAIRPRARFVA